MRIDVTLREPDGATHDVAVLAPDATPLADLAALLAPHAAVGGRLHPGGVLAVAGSVGRDLSDAGGTPASHHLDVVGGPDAGTSVALGRAPVTIGRAATCDLVLRDPDVSRMHAEIALTAHGPTVRDRGSLNGTTVDGARAGVDGAPVPDGRYVRLGDTYLGVSPGPTTAALTRLSADGTQSVNRPPRPPIQHCAEEIIVPTDPAPSRPQRVGWIAALVPAVAAGALALSMHAVQFLLFALLSPVAVLASALGDRVHWRRERRRQRGRHTRELSAARRRLAQAMAGETRSRRARDPDPATVLRTAQVPGARLWERQRGGADLLTVRLGLGDRPSHTRVRDGSDARAAGFVRAVPVTVDVAEGPLGVSGPREAALGVARWVVGQLATHVSPADLELSLLLSTGAEASWRWARWLPHLAGRVAFDGDEWRAVLSELTQLAEIRSAGMSRDGRWTGSWLLVVVDRSRALTGLPALSSLLRDGPRVGITALCVDTQLGGLPAGCVRVARVAGETGSRLHLSPADDERGLIADRVTPEWGERVARALAPLRDPGSGRAGSVPDTCRLLPLLGLTDLTAQSVLANWRSAPPGLTTPLGTAADGPVTIDLVRDGPHALVAGTTGSGKSELLRSLVAGLAARQPPESVAFVLVDYKGGAAFAECARLPHTVGLVTDLDAHLAERALQSLERELTRREELFAMCGASDLDEFRAAPPDGTTGPDGPVPRLVIVIDEFAELAAELGEFVSGLVGIARRGRSLGVHLVLATQRPSGAVSPEIRANTALRIALRVTDPTESRDIIDTDDAAAIGRRHPGRAYLRLPGSGPVLLQTAHVGASIPVVPAAPRVAPLDHWRRLSDDHITTSVSELQLLVEASSEAATLSGRPAPRRPWLSPLPERVAVADLGAVEGGPARLGLCDLPRTQQQVPWTLALPTGGSVLFAGGARSGRTSALLTLAISAATEHPPDQLHIYAIDCAGGGLSPLANLPHCGSVVGTDMASQSILVTRLHAAVADRRRRRALDPDTPIPMVLCVIDGWDALVAAADEYDGGHTVERLCELVRAGPSVGLTVAIAGDRATLATRLSSCVATKLLLRLTDRADYGLAGLKEQQIPVSPPPGRAVRAEDGVEIQLAHLGREPSPVERADAVQAARSRWADAAPRDDQLIRVRPLPVRVELRDVMAECNTAKGIHTTGTSTQKVVLGAGGDAGEPVLVDLFAGAARLLVAGPHRSGRSTVLLCVLRQVSESGGAVMVAAPARSPLTAVARSHGLQLITPDDHDVPAPCQGSPTVVLVDDSEAFLDTAAGATLTDWARDAAPGLAIVACGTSDELAVTFRGVAAEVRRARCTVLLHPGPGDTDLAGWTLPRREPGRPPGRGLLVGDPAWGRQFAEGPLAIQVAVP